MSGAAAKFSGPFRAVGAKVVDQAGAWLASAVTFGLAAGTGFLYFSDWKVCVAYIPFYKNKFPEETES